MSSERELTEAATDKVRERNRMLQDAQEERREIEQRLPAGLLFWYPFPEKASILYLLRRDEKPERAGLLSVLRDNGFVVTAISADVLTDALSSAAVSMTAAFDYCIAVGVMEESGQPDRLLKAVYAALNDEGMLLIGMINRFGLRYFVGDPDPYTGQIFDGVSNYREQWETGNNDHRRDGCYSRAEMEKLLHRAGFHHTRFNPVLPGLEAPQLIYAEGSVPEENMALRYFPYYDDPQKVFLEERELWNDMAASGLFQGLANAYLVECLKSERQMDASAFEHVTLALDRSRADSQATVIGTDGKVRKLPYYEEGKLKLDTLSSVANKLRARGVRVVDGHRERDAYVMPRVRAENGNLYFQRIFFEDRKLFFRELDAFCDLILRSGDETEPPEEIKKRFGEEGLGVWLTEGFPDMVPHNCFHDERGFLFYDQEFCEPTFPANYLIYRTVTLLYNGLPAMRRELPMEELFARFGLDRQMTLWQYYDTRFLGELRRGQAMEDYHRHHDPDTQQIRMNRLRMNETEEDYRRRYVNIFAGLDDRKIYLFGSGVYAKRYLDYYGDLYPASGLIDNRVDKQGGEVYGLPVLAPNELLSMPQGSYRVIICIRAFESVVQQLRDMGIEDYAVYIPTMDHLGGMANRDQRSCRQQKGAFTPGEEHCSREETAAAASKPYHIGYVAGVFDLYHIGHLNLFRRAKEQCDHLIAGVVSDEQVQASRDKKKAAYVPFEERLQLVQACRYVDEAVMIPPTAAGIQDMYRKYHFDAMFTGSDYAADPGWLSAKTWLEERGSTIVFFPYTESTSSSSLKALIDRQLL